MPPAIDKDAKIPCPTSQHLQIELDALMAVLELREQEDTWEKMERAIIRFTGITRGGGYKHLPLFIDGMGKMGVGLKLGQCMLSDRGRLSGVATELLQTLAPRLGPAFNPLIPVYLAPLVQLLGRPNKVFLKRAEKCLWTIISNCHLPSILTELKRGLSDEAATCRRGCAAGFERALIDWDRAQFGERGVGVMEEALRKVGGDKDPEVRNTGKRIWVKFSEIWPERVDEFSGPLTPTIRRYLGVSAAASAHAGPSKPKAAPIRHAPPKPAALSASTSSASMAALPPPPPSAPAPTAPPAPIAQMPPPPPPQSVSLPPPIRPQVLGGRAVRPPLLTTQSEALPSLPPLSASGESVRPRRSPVKFPLPGGPAVPSSSASYTDLADLHQLPPRQRILSARAPRYPPGVLGLGQHGRSISQSVLPTPVPDMPSPTFANIPLETGPVDHTPSDPLFARPAFPTSYSTTSLPSALPISEAWQPTRRFAGGGVRSVRPGLLSSSSEMDLLGGPSRSHTVPATPSVLRGAIRSGPLAPSQPSRRDLGQAQRRIISAPIPSSVSNPTFFTETIPELGRSTSVRDRIVEMERKAAEAEMEAAKVPLPISPVAERFGGAVSSRSGSRSGTPSVSRVRVGRGEGTEVDSPMMPVSMSILARSRNKGMDEEVEEKVEGDVSGGMEDMLMDEEIPNESVSDMTFSETREKASALQQRAGMPQLAEQERGEVRPPSIDAVEHPDHIPASLAASIPDIITPPVEILPPVAAAPTIPPTTTEALPQPRPTSPIVSSAAHQESLVTSEQPLAPPAVTQPKVRKPPLPPVSTGPTTAPTRRAAPVQTAAPSERLPPVAATRPVKPRLPANEPRKPFRPTTKPPLASSSNVPATASSSNPEVTAGAREQIIRVSKPPIPSRGAPPVSRAVSASRAPSSSSSAATTSAAVAAGATTVVPPVRPRVASTSSNLTKPTAASLHRATAQTAPKPRLPSSTSTATSAPISTSSLPPAVKKDKVKRKAAVPSFRPTRAGAEATAKGTASLSASTISHRSTSASGAGRDTGVDGGKGAKEIVAKVKVRVKPESVPLPLSPGEKRAVEIPLPASPVIGEFTGRVKVRAKPVVIDLVSTDEVAEKPDSISADMVPLPPSPTSAVPPLLALVSTPSSPDTPAIPYPILSPIVHHTLSESPTRQISKLNDLGLPILTSHTPISKASTAPAGSDWAGSDSEDDDRAEVTFGKNGNKGRWETVDLMMDNVGERDLIEFSAASRDPHSSLDRQAGDEGVEKDLIEFSAPSRPLLLDGVENDLIRVEGGVVREKGGMGKGDLGMMSGSCGTSPRVALSVVDRNGARDEDLTI